ncbi:MAG: VPLPA-CTERM sorting domain-containing protein [Paracoccaceae bacterium]
MKKFSLALCVGAISLAGASISSAATFSLIFGDGTVASSNATPTGSSATIGFDFSDLMGDVRLTLTIDNDTDDTNFGAGASEGTLTAFGFDVVAGAIFDSFTGGANLDTLIQDDGFNSNAPGVNKAQFDLVAADNSNFLGGNANNALPEGQIDTVLFDFETLLSATDLAAQFEAGFADGTLKAGLRFQQVNAGSGSDQLVFIPPVNNNPPPSPVPLPAGVPLLLTGLVGVGLLRRRAR